MFGSENHGIIHHKRLGLSKPEIYLEKHIREMAGVMLQTESLRWGQ